MQQLLTHTQTPKSEGMYIKYDDSVTMKQAAADFQIFHVFTANNVSVYKNTISRQQ